MSEASGDSGPDTLAGSPELGTRPTPDSSGRPKPGYIVALAGAAVVLLAVGSLLKPKKLAVESPVPLTESAPLQALSRRSQLSDLTDFLSERVSAVSPHLVYLENWGASGVAWADPDSAVIAGRDDAPVIAVRRTGDTTAVPSVRITPERAARRGWVLVAARQRDGTVVSAIGMSGGQTPLRCGDQVYRELVLATPLAATFEGGGLFDLEGSLLGIVGRCGNRDAALSVADVRKALTASAEHQTGLLRFYGLRVAALDEIARRYFAVDSGVLVAEVVLTSPAGEAGLHPGDVIVGLDGQPVRNPRQLEGPASTLSAGRTLALVRNGRPMQIALPNPGSSRDTMLGIELSAENGGPLLARVEPGSRAERAGLRTGDRLIRIGRLEPRTPLQAQRALSRTGQHPLYLVFRREDSEHGVFLR